nr:PRC-barrel domain-containing protein [uncultured Bacillus sp.]
MKNSTQIIGLPIISITDGVQVGKVKSLVINPEKGAVDFLTIEHDDWQVSVKAIPFKKVIGIGEFAVTIDSDSAIIDLNEIPIANQLVNKKITILNTRVMTRKGELIGEINEFYVDEETGLILGMALKASESEVALSSDYVMTYGKDIIIVKEDAPKNFLSSTTELDPSRKKEEAANLKQSTDSVSESLPDQVKAKEMEEDAELAALKKKQIDILKGKRLTKTIYSTSGQVLLEEGMVLTPEDIAKVQKNSPSSVVELSMNVEE